MSGLTAMMNIGKEMEMCVFLSEVFSHCRGEIRGGQYEKVRRKLQAA